MLALGTAGLAACGRLGFESVDLLASDAPIDDPPSGAQLRAHFPFEGNGQTALADSSEFGHVSSCTDCPVLSTDARLGAQSASFAGGECLHVNDEATLRADTFSYTAWLKTNPLPTAGDFRTAFSRPFASETGFENVFELVVDSIGSNTEVVLALLIHQRSSRRTLSVETWHHVAVTYDGTRARVYVDGVLDSLESVVSLGITDNDVLIGCDRDNGSDYAFYSGLLDDLRVYAGVLNDAEVAALAAAP
jgi:hypothetical protein